MKRPSIAIEFRTRGTHVYPSSKFREIVPTKESESVKTIIGSTGRSLCDNNKHDGEMRYMQMQNMDDICISTSKSKEDVGRKVGG